VVEHQADGDTFGARPRRRRNQDQEAVALDVDVDGRRDHHRVRGSRRLDQGFGGQPALQVERLAPGGIGTDDDRCFERRGDPRDGGERRQQRGLAVGAASPVGGVGDGPGG
jgi:hypothetical protein